MILGFGLNDSAEIKSQCSRTKCSNLASVKIIWRNPKIHTEDREKVWLACDEHTQYLTDFLRARNFPVKLDIFNSNESSN